MKKTILRKYAQLIAQVGANVQKDQEVFLEAELDQPEFVEMLVEECYKCGAKKVVVDFGHQPLQKLHYKYRSQETLNHVDHYEEAKWQHKAEVLPCRIMLISEDPDGLRGINQEKLAKAQQARYPILKPYRDQMEGKHQWCIAAVPGKAWAKKMFPELRVSQAVEKLWQAILDACRVWEDPVAEWEKHDENMKNYCTWLNGLPIDKLHYTSKNGTDFTVGLMPESQFCGGREALHNGVIHGPNLPTEECFTSPKRGEAEGVVYGTKPLCYRGQLIEDFWIRFHEGKAVEWHAEKNESMLTKIINMDEGSAYLGECALVPYNSPISQSGLLFYNTLFDENAACHLALGEGFPNCVRDFQNKTLEECHALGVNDSMVHEDFMIGSEDMNIDAILTDGTIVPVFRDGNWAR